MHSPIFHEPSWDQSRNCCEAQGNLCRGSCFEREHWIGLQAGDCQWELSTGNIPVAVTKLKGDTPSSPMLLSYKAVALLRLHKAVGGTVGCPTGDGKQAECAEGISTGYVLLNGLREQTLHLPGMLC